MSLAVPLSASVTVMRDGGGAALIGGRRDRDGPVRARCRRRRCWRSAPGSCSTSSPVTVSDAAGVSTSPIVKLSAAVGVSSVVVCSAMSEIVGRSLTAVTVRTKVSVAVPLSASRHGERDGGGAALIERRGDRDGPGRARAAEDDVGRGTSGRFDEVAVTVSDAAGVSTSPTVKLSAAVGVSSVVVVSAMSEIVGRSLTAVTVRTEGVARGAAVAVGHGDA